MGAAKCCARSGKKSRKRSCKSLSGRWFEIWQESYRAMSRIGRKPIPVPAGVKINLTPGAIDVQGPKGKMNVKLPRGITLEQKGAELHAIRQSDDQAALHGLARALVANAVTGCTTGFKKEMDIVGVGYRAELKGKMVSFALGYSHPVEFHIPEVIQVTFENSTRVFVLL